MPQPFYIFNDNPGAPLLHLAPANGFPLETYIPLLRPLYDRYQIVSLPPRALWPDESPPDKHRDWRMVADDLLAGIQQHDLRDLIAVGHSFGGVATILAALRAPERFRALIMLDPTILPQPGLDMIDAAVEQGVIEQHFLVQGARRRRRHFQSVDEAYNRLKDKSLFAGWPDETIRLYVRYGTRPVDDGVTLVWSPEWEAYYFSTMYTGIWQDVARLRNLLPVLFVRGGTSDTFLTDAEARLRDLVPDATYAVIPSHGHLFPQSAPDATRDIIQNWLANNTLD